MTPQDQMSAILPSYSSVVSTCEDTWSLAAVVFDRYAQLLLWSDSDGQQLRPSDTRGRSALRFPLPWRRCQTRGERLALTPHSRLLACSAVFGRGETTVRAA